MEPNQIPQPSNLSKFAYNVEKPGLPTNNDDWDPNNKDHIAGLVHKYQPHYDINGEVFFELALTAQKQVKLILEVDPHACPQILKRCAR